MTDELVRNARRHRADFRGPRAMVPARHVAIVTCMDSRIDNFAIFGLDSGEAHIIRNAGGIVTDDVLRSLVVSQRVLETREILVVQHTNCGLHGADERAMRERIRSDAGAEPPYAFGAFPDLDGSVRSSIDRLRSDPFLIHRDRIRGFVYDVDNGDLREIS